MNQKKKARRARGLGSDPGLDLAISRFTNSLDVDTLNSDVDEVVSVIDADDFDRMSVDFLVVSLLFPFKYFRALVFAVAADLVFERFFVD
jgi:hypothetical protein